MLYRTVKTDIWRDPWFVDLAPQSKCLFMYLFTNASVSACGAMEISLSQMAFDTKIPVKKLPAELERFGDKVLWLPEKNIIVVRNFYRHQRSQSSENFAKAARKAMADIPAEAQVWLGEVYPELKEGMDAPKDTHPQPLPNPSPTLGDKEEALATVVAEALAGAEETGDTPQPPKGEVIPPEFVEFWERYPTGFGSKPKTLAAWKKVRKEHAAIMAGLESWHRSERWQKGFIKASELWLRDRLWENPPPAPKGEGGFILPPGFRLPPGTTVNQLQESLVYRNSKMSLPEERERLVDAYLAAMNGSAVTV